MSLSQKVSTIINIHTQELWFIQEFCKDFGSYIHHRKSETASVEIPSNIKAEYRRLAGEFSEFLQKNESTLIESTLTGVRIKLVFEPKKGYSKECIELLGHQIMEAFKTIVYPHFIYDMALTHAITIFEALLSDFLAAIFTERPSTLKSQNVATFEQILSFSSMKQLINDLAVNKTKKILDENIDKVANDLENMFSIDMTTLNGFDIIREASYRRHIIVHNKGIIDKKYHEKIPNSEIGARLSTDSEYVIAVITAVGQFVDSLDDCFARKMHYNREQSANRILHPETTLSVEEIDDS